MEDNVVSAIMPLGSPYIIHIPILDQLERAHMGPIYG